MLEKSTSITESTFTKKQQGSIILGSYPIVAAAGWIWCPSYYLNGADKFVVVLTKRISNFLSSSPAQGKESRESLSLMGPWVEETELRLQDIRVC